RSASLSSAFSPRRPSCPISYFFSLYCSGHHRDLHSFPTRRSSDLAGKPVVAAKKLLRCTGDSLSTLTLSTCFLSPEHFIHAFPADRKSTRLNSSHVSIAYAVFCLKKKNRHPIDHYAT